MRPPGVAVDAETDEATFGVFTKSQVGWGDLAGHLGSQLGVYLPYAWRLRPLLGRYHRVAVEAERGACLWRLERLAWLLA